MKLKFDQFKHYIDRFNKEDHENVVQDIDNASSYAWLEENIPLFECPDKILEETYYFRWWTYRKHVKHTEDGYIITEFHPDVSWAGKHNSIVCPAGHHFYEGRWLRNRQYLDDYARFWFTAGDARSYSTWLIDAIWHYCKTKGDASLSIALLDDFIKHQEAWEKSHRHASGLFWSIDDRDGGEHSISGNGLRPTLNTYMAANYKALSEIYRYLKDERAEIFDYKYKHLKDLIYKHLWDQDFFKVYPLDAKETQTDLSRDQVNEKNNVRELHGYIPFAFDMYEKDHLKALSQMHSEKGFLAPFGLTTAERRHDLFMAPYDKHQCLWNGPSWPFLTCFAIKGLAKATRQYDLDKSLVYDQLIKYAGSHRRMTESGQVMWIDENLNPFTGEWEARSILESWGWPAHKGGKERGKDYNHSFFNDLIISDLIGLTCDLEGVKVNPLIPDDWDYFLLDGISYKDKILRIVYDKTGKHYQAGKGLSVYLNDTRIKI